MKPLARAPPREPPHHDKEAALGAAAARPQIRLGRKLRPHDQHCGALNVPQGSRDPQHLTVSAEEASINLWLLPVSQAPPSPPLPPLAASLSPACPFPARLSIMKHKGSQAPHCPRDTTAALTWVPFVSHSPPGASLQPASAPLIPRTWHSWVTLPTLPATT